MTTLRLGILSELLGGNSALDPYVEPFRRVEGPLLAHGVALVREDADVILADVPQIEEIAPTCPVILFEKSDGGMFWWQFASHAGKARSWLKAPAHHGRHQDKPLHAVGPLQSQRCRRGRLSHPPNLSGRLRRLPARRQPSYDCHR